MDSLSLWVVSNEGKRFYFDIGEEAVEYCNNNGINFDRIYQIIFYRKIFDKLPNGIEVKKAGKTVRYLKIGRNEIECCEVSRNNKCSADSEDDYLVDSSSSDYKDLCMAFNERGIDISNVSDYTLLFFRGFVYDYSREAMEYLKDKKGVYRVDYYRMLDGVADVICYFNSDSSESSRLIYSDGLLGYRVLDKDGKARSFIDGQYLNSSDIDNWYSVLEGTSCCIRVSRESVRKGGENIFWFRSAFIDQPIKISEYSRLRRVLQK